MIQVTLKLTDGTCTTVNLACDMPTIEDVRQSLISQQGYAKSVQIMSGAAILKGTRRVDEFPYGSLLVVGQKVGTQRPLSPQPQPAAARHTTSASHHHHTSAHDHPQQHHKAHETSSGEPSAPAEAHRAHAESPRPTTSPRHAAVFVVNAVVPSIRKKLHLSLTAESTLADLITSAVSKESSLLGCKVLFQDRVVTGPTKTLSSLMIGPDATVYIGAGEFANPNHLILHQISEEYLAVKHEVESGIGALSLQQRKGLHEKLMRALFRTDDITELADEWRVKRKQLVQSITSLQDALQAGDAQ